MGLTIETERLRLRPFVEDDLDALARINGDEEVMRHLGGRTMSRDETWRQLALIVGHMTLRGYSILAIEERSTGELVGRSGPWFPEGWPLLEVGWVIARDRQGRGYASEAGAASVDWCFGTLGVDEVCSLVRPANTASARVAEKLGARLERRLDDFLGGPTDVWIHRPATRRRPPRG